ncbi:unnamed protein product, partial [Mesorhabditis spiculigera]
MDFTNSRPIRDTTGEDGTVAPTDGTLTSGMIVAILLGCLFLCGVGVVALYTIYLICNKSKPPTSQKKEIAVEEGLPDPPSKQTSVSKPLSANNTVPAPHEDLRHLKVQNQIDPKKLSRIIKAVYERRTVPSTETSILKDTTGGRRKPEIVKVITYATDDQITYVDPKTIDDHLTDAPPELDLASRLLVQILRHGPRSFTFRCEELCQLLQMATDVFKAESSLVEVAVPCVMYGDIHGQYSDLFRWFNFNGWPYKTRSVFLGDFVDRGSHGVEVLALMAALKVVFPTGVYMVRGNHEEEMLNKTYSFYDEVMTRFGESGAPVYQAFKELFAWMPMAALVNKQILGVHGGISPKLRTLDDIIAIERPVDVFTVGSLACDLVWSDPNNAKNAKRCFRANLDREPVNGIGQLFAPDAVQKTCAKLDIDLIVRGHQSPINGYSTFADKKVLTIFSAPGYRGTEADSVNMGASLVVDANMEMTIKRIQVSANFRKKRIEDEKLYQSSIRKNKSTSQASDTSRTLSVESQRSAR